MTYNRKVQGRVVGIFAGALLSFAAPAFASESDGGKTSFFHRLFHKTESAVEMSMNMPEGTDYSASQLRSAHGMPQTVQLRTYYKLPGVIAEPVTQRTRFSTTFKGGPR